MLSSYLAMSWRRLRRYSLQSLTGLTCLTVGIAVCLLIALFLRHELSFDSYHPDADRIYRANWINVGSGARFATFFNPASPLLSDALPQIENFARLARSEAVLEVAGERHFPTLSLVDAQFFDLFHYEVLQGNTAGLTDLMSAVLTEAAARQIFGRSDVVGQTFLVNDELLFEIVAVVENNRSNSHLVSNIFLNIEIIPSLFNSPDFWENTGSDIMYHYLKLAPAANVEDVERAVVSYLAEQSPVQEEFFNQVDVRLQSLLDMHFTTDLQNEMTVRDDLTGAVKPHRQWGDVSLFAAVALLTLIIAVFNFVNLQLAMASLRARELGVRRTVGASRLDVALQFLAENLLSCLLAMLAAIVLVFFSIDYFSVMVAAQLNPMSLLSVSGVMALLLTLLLLAVIAGGYPAFILSRLSPVLALRGQLGRELSGTGLRAGLVLAQFVISIALLISAGIVNKQLDFALDKSLGFDPNNVMVVELGPSQARQAYELMRSELLGQASIESVSAGSIVPTRSLSDGATFNHAEESGLSSLTTRRISVSDDYFQTLGMELLSGRALDSSRPGDFMPAIGPDNLEVSGGVIFNEAAARQAGWSDPEQAIGQALFSEFSFGGLNFRMNFTVVGVVADAHYGSVRNEIAPISYALDNNRRYMIIRARPGAMMQATEAAERVWQQAVPDYPVRRLNMEAEYSALYAGENRTFILFMGLASMAIIMSCFGLYGLASLIAETRRKEISIRKVLGASVQQLMIMLSWSICRLVLLANIIAWPAAFWIMQNWLNNFAYRTAMDISIFIFATLTTLTIALLTVMHRTWAAASISPVAALRAE